MLTGTPLDLTPFGSLLGALGLMYWVIALGVMAAALWFPRSWLVKLSMAAVVGGVFVIPVMRHAQGRQTQRDAGRARLEESMALFRERCKGAGEKVVRTVDNVDGVVWMKWRDDDLNYSAQFKLDDPYGKDCSAKDCISMLLRVASGAALAPDDAKRHATGFRFVETTDPRDGQLLRYTARIGVTGQRTPETLEQYKKNTGQDPGLDMFGFVLDRESIEKFTARYGITWDDTSTHEDREHWIAGSSLKIVDLRTNEVIAERIGYMIDQGQGSQAGFRSPWLFAQQNF